MNESERRGNRNFVCDCPACLEYAFSHTRVKSIAIAQDEAFREAAAREVDELVGA